MGPQASGRLAHAAVVPANRGNFPWELGYIVDDKLRETGFAVVRGSLQRDGHLRLLDQLARDHQIIGMTCQGVFPMRGDLPGSLPDERGLKEGRDKPYIRRIGGWAHCFRNPDDYLPPDRPRILFANSDNMDPGRVWDVATRSGPLEKRWDFIYSCMPEPANFVRKNWDLAKRSAIRMADEMGLRGLMVGVAGVADAPIHPLIDLSPKLPWAQFLRVLGESRVAFFPNTWDPSPRMMAEALCLDVVLLVNRTILGGWHYVAAGTGRWFADETDVSEAMAALRAESLHPREWYIAHYGRQNAGPRLANFVRLLAAGDGRNVAVESASFYSPRDYNGALPRPAAVRRPNQPPCIEVADPRPERRHGATAGNAGTALDRRWIRWLALNKLRDVDDDVLIAQMTKNGIAGDAGRSVLRRMLDDPLYGVASELSQRLRTLESVMGVSRALSDISAAADQLECRAVLSRAEFIEEYYARNRPVAFDDMTSRWAARSWTPETLRHRFGEVDGVLAGEPLLADLQPLPEFLDPDHSQGRVSITLGPAGTGTPLYREVVNLLFVQIYGRQRHILISPDHTPLVYNDVDVYSKIDVENPDLERYPLFSGVRAFALILGPGDSLFVPVGWWHQVHSLDISISTALSNFAVPNSYEFFSPSIAAD